MKLSCGILAFACILALGQAAPPIIYNPNYHYKEVLNDKLNELIQQSMLDASAQTYYPRYGRIIYEKMLKGLKELAQQESVDSAASAQRMLPYKWPGYEVADTKSDQEADQQEKMAHEEKWTKWINAAIKVAPFLG